MSRLKVKKQEFNKETGKAIFIYGYKNHLFEGVANCHEDDMDMNSELVGLKYAETRAFYKFLKVRRQELEDRLKTLEGLFNNLLTSKDFDIGTKYGRKLQKTICETRCELFDCREGIKNIPDYLENDINSRELMYKKIRERRKERDA